MRLRWYGYKKLDDVNSPKSCTVIRAPQPCKKICISFACIEQDFFQIKKKKNYGSEIGFEASSGVASVSFQADEHLVGCGADDRRIGQRAAAKRTEFWVIHRRAIINLVKLV